MGAGPRSYRGSRGPFLNKFVILSLFSRAVLRGFSHLNTPCLLCHSFFVSPVSPELSNNIFPTVERIICEFRVSAVLARLFDCVSFHSFAARNIDEVWISDSFYVGICRCLRFADFVSASLYLFSRLGTLGTFYDKLVCRYWLKF